MTPPDLRALVKFCGATTEEEAQAAAAAGATHLGLWWGVPGSERSLPTDRLAELAAATTRAGLTPWLVTLSDDVAAIARTMAATGIDAVQLHAFQRPAVVAALRGVVATGATIVKVLHLQDGVWLDGRYARAYVDAGTDLFVLDHVADGRIGSTGRAADPDAVLRLAEQLPARFLLAGGVGADRDEDLRIISRHTAFSGVDVDTKARGPHGLLDAGRMRDVVETWLADERIERTHQ